MINVKEIAAARKAALAKVVEEKHLQNAELVIIHIGYDPASESYIKGKVADCNEVGIKSRVERFDGEDVLATIQGVTKTIYDANVDSNVRGIILQLPVPDKLMAYVDMFIKTINPEKDVDGLRTGSPFTPCTPLGINILLNAIDFDPCGKVCTVIGRSRLVGSPMAKLLNKANATVIHCNSRTRREDLTRAIEMSDLVISAVGKAGLLTEACLGSGEKVVVDVGINRGEDGKLCGDVAKCLYSDKAMITPVPGGVGLMTRVALLENTIRGAAYDG